jgi:sugar O-acyltransferase (sialic acid O-acetyltransferase NeuD family)
MALTTKTQESLSSSEALNENVHPKDIIIFGLDKMASLSWYVLTHDSPYNVIAFTADKDYCNCTNLHGLPVVPFDKLTEIFPPEEFGMHLPIGWKAMNKLRARKLNEACKLGYSIISYLSSRAIVWPDLSWGSNCEIHQATSIGPFVRIGDNCLIFSCTLISHHSVIGNHCFIAGRAKVLAGAVIGDRCVLGADCMILPGVKVAPDCFIAAGSLITKDTVENSVYMGSPAQRRKIPANCFPAAK